MPKNVKLGKNRTIELTKTPIRKPIESVASNTDRVAKGIISVNIADKAIINERPERLARSAQRPPTKYPIASAIIVTEMSDDQTLRLPRKTAL